MSDTIQDSLHAARVLLSEQNQVDRTRWRLPRVAMMRASRMFTHRLVAAVGHVVDAAQMLDSSQHRSTQEFAGQLSTLREQTGQLTAATDAMGAGLRSSIAEVRDHFDARDDDIHAQLKGQRALVTTLESALQAVQARLVAGDEVMAYQRAELKRLRTLVDRLVRSTRQPAEAGESEPEWDGRGLDEQAYLDFENRFRGSRDEIRERQKGALRFVDGFSTELGLLLDLACGRGEWLEVLRSEGIEAYGVDSNAAMIAEVAKAGLDVRCEDALVHLKGVAESSLQGISAFHFVEHIPLGVLVTMLDDSLLALAPGGKLLLETPNPTNLMVGAASFYLDPTHVRPIHPEFLRFLVESRGFVDVQVHYLHPAVPEETLVAAGPSEGYPDARLNRAVTTLESVVYGPQDYMLVASRPGVASVDGLLLPVENLTDGDNHPA